MRKLIENPIVNAVLRWTWELFLSMLQTACLMAVAGAVIYYAATRADKSTATETTAEGDWLQVVLDESQLVRCKAFVDRASCVQFTGCEDKVDRCVVTFEILRRPIGPSDYLPTEDKD